MGGSRGRRRARLRGRRGGRLRHRPPRHAPARGPDYQRKLTAQLDHARENLERAEEEAQRVGVRYESDILEGDAVECIAEAARYHAADLVVVGSRGHGARRERADRQRLPQAPDRLAGAGDGRPPAGAKPERPHDRPPPVPPWKIKVVEPITLPRRSAAAQALAEAGYNTFLLRAEDVFVDLLTDSGTSALSQEQRAAMELGDESYAGSRSFFRLEEAVRETYGFRHVIPAHQGRGAEHLLARILVEPGQLVPSNLYFTTSRAHAELAGGVWVDVSIPEASDPASEHPFKGNIDLVALERVLAAAAPEGVAFVRQEACLNMAGGQPFSIENLRGVRELTRAHGVPFILDATRISENALFVKRREPGYADSSLAAIVREIASYADGAVFSSKKDHFVPIGGLLALNDDLLAEKARELVVVYEGFPHYGGIAGAGWRRSPRASASRSTRRSSRHYVGQSAYLGGLLIDAGDPGRPAARGARGLPRREAVPPPPRRTSSSRPSRSPPRSTSRAGCGRWSAGSSRASTATSRTTGSSSCG